MTYTGLAAYRAALERDTAELRTRTAELDRAIADAYVTTERLEADQDPELRRGGARRRGPRGSRAQDPRRTIRSVEAHTSMSDQQFARAREELTAAQQSADAIAADAARCRRSGSSSSARCPSTFRCGCSGPSSRPTPSRDR